MDTTKCIIFNVTIYFVGGSYELQFIGRPTETKFTSEFKQIHFPSEWILYHNINIYKTSSDVTQNDSHKFSIRKLLFRLFEVTCFYR